MLNEQKCVRCGKKEDSVKLFDGIYITESVKICEKCAIIAGVPIIKRPSADQLKDSEKPYAVRSRLMKMAGLAVPEKKGKSALEELNDLESKPELEKPDSMSFRLVDNYNWLIQTTRRRKGLTAKQLAAAISESEAAVDMLEHKSIPRNSLQLIRKIEQILNLNLIKRDSFGDVVGNVKLPPLEPFKEKNEEFIEKIEVMAPAKKDEVGPSAFSREMSEKFRMRDLQRANKIIDNDMDSSVKSREQVGNEQTSRFGKEDSANIARKVYDSYERKELKTKGKVPSIYDLMKKKEERDRTSMSGKDIQVTDDDLE